MRAVVPLLFFMAGVQGFVLTLPLYGPLLFQLAAASGVEAAPYATSFLNAYAFSFLAWGVLLHKLRLDWKRIISLTAAVVSVCLALSLCLLWLSPLDWSALFIGIGLLASMPSLAWMFFIGHVVPQRRIGFAFGLNGVLVSGFHLLFTLSGVEPVAGLLMASGMLILALVSLLRIRKLPPPRADFAHAADRKPSNPAPLFLFIFIIFLLGGIMYQVVNPFLSGFPFVGEYFDKLTYMAVMPLAGWIVDRQGFKSVVVGMAFLGLAYIVFAFFSTFPAAVAGSALLQIGFAFLDVFVLYALSIWARRDKPFLLVGSGLCVYIASIRAGLLLHDIIVPISLGNYEMTFMAALVILLISFLLVQWLGEKEPREVEKQLLMKELSAYYTEKDEEFKLAGKIQQQLLPEMPRLPGGIEAAVHFSAAKEVAGDFYDILVCDENRTLFVIGDVTGKGLPAALIMSNLVGLIRSEAHRLQDLPDMIRQVNRVFYREHSHGMHVTLGIALIDTGKGTLTYASAGHVSPYRIRAGRVEPIDSSSLPVGMDEELKPYVVTMPLDRRDVLVLYTDGIVETQNADRQLYGFDRLEQLLEGLHPEERSPERIKSRILDDVRRFAPDSAQKDDVTLLVIRIGG